MLERDRQRIKIEHCNTLQHPATCYTTLHHAATSLERDRQRGGDGGKGGENNLLILQMCDLTADSGRAATERAVAVRPLDWSRVRDVVYQRRFVLMNCALEFSCAMKFSCVLEIKFCILYLLVVHTDLHSNLFVC